MDIERTPGDMNDVLGKNKKLQKLHSGGSFMQSSVNSSGFAGFVNRVIAKLARQKDADIVAFVRGYGPEQSPDGKF